MLPVSKMHTIRWTTGCIPLNWDGGALSQITNPTLPAPTTAGRDAPDSPDKTTLGIRSQTTLTHVHRRARLTITKRNPTATKLRGVFEGNWYTPIRGYRSVRSPLAEDPLCFRDLTRFGGERWLIFQNYDYSFRKIYIKSKSIVFYSLF